MNDLLDDLEETKSEDKYEARVNKHIEQIKGLMDKIEEEIKAEVKRINEEGKPAETEQERLHKIIVKRAKK